MRTSGHEHGDAEARQRAVHLALGGTALPVLNRPSHPAATFAEIDRLSSAAAEWHEVASTGTRVLCTDGFTVGYRQLPSGTVFVAAVGTPADSLRVRPVADWDQYDVNATTSFPLSALHRD